MDDLQVYLDIFCNPIGMSISDIKSSFLEFGIDEGALLQLKSFLPFEVKSLDVGFKYLGYYLMKNNYLKEDWF